MSTMLPWFPNPHAFNLGITAGRGGTGSHVTPCAVRSQHKYFHTHYNNTGNWYHHHNMYPVTVGARRSWPLMNTSSEHKCLAHTQECGMIIMSWGATLKLMYSFAYNQYKQVDITWPNYDTVKLYTFSPHSYMLSTRWTLRVIVGSVFPCCAIQYQGNTQTHTWIRTCPCGSEPEFVSARVHEWKDHVVKPYEFNGRQTHMLKGSWGICIPQKFWLRKVDSGTSWMVWELYSFWVVSQHQLDSRWVGTFKRKKPTAFATCKLT